MDSLINTRKFITCLRCWPRIKWKKKNTRS